MVCRARARYLPAAYTASSRDGGDCAKSPNSHTSEISGQQSSSYIPPTRDWPALSCCIQTKRWSRSYMYLPGTAPDCLIPSGISPQRGVRIAVVSHGASRSSTEVPILFGRRHKIEQHSLPSTSGPPSHVLQDARKSLCVGRRIDTFASGTCQQRPTMVTDLWLRCTASEDTQGGRFCSISLRFFMPPLP